MENVANTESTTSVVMMTFRIRRETEERSEIGEKTKRAERLWKSRENNVKLTLGAPK